MIKIFTMLKILINCMYPILQMGSGPESHCVGHVYGLDGAV